jgi:hypothetical protein
MSLTLTPIVSSLPPYNANVSWINSWISVENDQNRPLYAQAVYPITSSSTDDLLTELINVIRQKENDNGFDFIDDANLHEGSYQTLKLVADSKVIGLTADNTTVGNLSSYELPSGFELNGQIYAFQLEYGAVLAYKTIEVDRYPNSIVGLNGKVLVSIQDGQGIVTVVNN